MIKKLAILFCFVILCTACQNRSRAYHFSSPPASISAPAMPMSIAEELVTEPVTRNTEEYNPLVENPFVKTSGAATSTFSLDADGGAYSNVRRFLRMGSLPPIDAVRTEELINYFNFDYKEPQGNHPISLEGEISECPWAKEHKLMRIGIKGKEMKKAAFPASNIVFLVDISGSMSDQNKLPLLKAGMKMMVKEMRADDYVSIVTYASNPGTALGPTSGDKKNKILRAIDYLAPNGSTNGEGGIKTAYALAKKNFIDGGNNRIILGTDGDFNVGISSQNDLIELIEEEREKGIFLTVVGLGIGNYKEGQMEQLANNGNGTYEYIDDIEQARKVFVEEYNKFFTVAKDVKVQIEFNPDIVSKYRLIGYENRILTTEEFEDDRKDAAEIAAGQSITALYELVTVPNSTAELNAFEVDFRYKSPNSNKSQLLKLSVSNVVSSFEQASHNHQFASAVAAFSLLLRASEYAGTSDYHKVKEWASRSNGFDPYGYKKEFTELIDWAE